MLLLLATRGEKERSRDPGHSLLVGGCLCRPAPLHFQREALDLRSPATDQIRGVFRAYTLVKSFRSVQQFLAKNIYVCSDPQLAVMSMLGVVFFLSLPQPQDSFRHDQHVPTGFVRTLIVLGTPGGLFSASSPSHQHQIVLLFYRSRFKREDERMDPLFLLLRRPFKKRLMVFFFSCGECSFSQFVVFFWH